MPHKTQSHRKLLRGLITLKLERMFFSLLLVLILLATGSCRNPYALKVGRLDYSGPQKKAVIQFSDPQIYKREALINERRDEREYLEELLENSRTQTFEPELMRDLELISVFSASLGVKFDPAAAINFQRAVELGDLQQEIQVTKLQMQLVQLRRDLDLLNEQLTQQESPSEQPGQADSDVTPVPSGPSSPSKEDIKSVTDLLGKLAKDVIGRLDMQSKDLRKAGATASPRDVFLDRQAYRNDIRNALNAASLDELHDYQGNSLYRMQFQATVLPGLELNKLGILRMVMEPPVFDQKNSSDIEVLEDLYLKWLGHVTRRLNQVGHDGDIKPNLVLLQLGATGIYFDILEYQVPKPGAVNCVLGPVFGTADTENCQIIRIALSPGSARDVAETYDTARNASHRIKDVLQRGLAYFQQGIKNRKNNISSQPHFSLSQNNRCGTFLEEKEVDGTEGFTNKRIFVIARSVLEAESTMIQSMGYQAELGDLPPEDRERIISMMTNAIEDLRDKLEEFAPLSRDIITVVRDLNPESLDFLPDPQKNRRLVRGVPPDFKAALIKDNGAKSKFKGRISVYAASPIELVQRVSSVARAANALEFAAALAATLPAQGVGASGTLGYTRSATGKVDALERVPLVVGFSEPNNSDTTQGGGAGFGWLLGPEVILNPENQALELEHRIQPYSLTADISVPSWWPYFKLNAQTAWAPNWKTGTGSILDDKVVHTKTVRVPMRHNQADLDKITDILVARFAGQPLDIAEIERIEPDIVSACAGKVTFLIRGMNLWRGTEVYLLGQKGTNIKVLPDMAGIAVTFDIGNLPQRSFAEKTPSKLMIWTRNGVATAEVTITGKMTGANVCVDEPLTPDDGNPRVEKILPGELFACDPAPHFVVKGRNLNNVRAVYLGTLKADTYREVEPKNGTVIEVSFNKRIDSKCGTLTKLPLIVRTAAGIDSKDVTVGVAKCK